MGFTPINVPQVGKTNVACANEVAAHEKCTTTAENATTQTLAKHKDQLVAPTAASSMKPDLSKGKKRAVRRGNVSNTKRRRTSNVQHSFSIAKPPESAPPGPSKTSQANVIPADEVGAPQSSKPRNVENDAQLPSASIKSVSTYVPRTSMDSLDTTLAYTAFKSVQANAGHSLTVYQGSLSSASLSTDIGVAQPWRSSVFSIQHPRSTLTGELCTPDLLVHDLPKPYVPCDSVTLLQLKSDYQLSASSEEQDTHMPEDSRQHYEGYKADELAQEPGSSTRLRTIATAHIHCANPVEDANQPGAAEGLTTSGPGRLFADDAVDEFGSVEDEELINFAINVEKAIDDRSGTPVAKRRRQQNMRDVNEDEDYGGAPLSDADRKRLVQYKPPSDTVDPIVRKPFQPSVHDRSPISGVSKGTVLRTCFRVGEALNTGSQAVRYGNNVMIELYARVTSSSREVRPGRKQHFVFKDLYHDKPPHLEGSFELWDQAQLWDLDSKAFLAATEQGIKCRAVGRMKRDGQKWGLEVLSIWEAGWGDVNHVAGLYKDGRDDEDAGQ